MRLKAFTFLELLVVIAITGIVVALSYTSYQMVFAQQSAYKRTVDGVYDLKLLETVLYKEVQQAVQVNHVGGELILKQFNEEVVSYHFYNDFVLRKNLTLSDTFYVKTASFNTKTLHRSDLVCDMVVEVPLHETNYKFSIHKDYGAEVLLSLVVNNGFGKQ